MEAVFFLNSSIFITDGFLYREDIIQADIEVKDLIIRNISTFDTTLAHLDLENLSLELGLSIGELRVRYSLLRCMLYDNITDYCCRATLFTI